MTPLRDLTIGSGNLGASLPARLDRPTVEWRVVFGGLIVMGLLAGSGRADDLKPGSDAVGGPIPVRPQAGSTPRFVTGTPSSGPMPGGLGTSESILSGGSTAADGLSPGLSLTLDASDSFVESPRRPAPPRRGETAAGGTDGPKANGSLSASPDGSRPAGPRFGGTAAMPQDETDAGAMKGPLKPWGLGVEPSLNIYEIPYTTQPSEAADPDAVDDASGAGVTSSSYFALLFASPGPWILISSGIGVIVLAGWFLNQRRAARIRRCTA